MSKRIDDQLRKAVELAKRAGAVTPPQSSERDEDLAEQELRARLSGIGGKSSQS